MKKILISLSIIGVVAAIATGVTIALFSDVETSTGNIFVAGTMDLKVDHVRQTYNDVDCKTCEVMVKSDTSNYVVERSANAVAAWVHPTAWTASIPEAIWIWPDNPTRQEDTNNNVIYTFQKTFEWWGPINGATLNLGVGADNSYEVWLNGTKIGGDVSERNFTTSTQDTYSGAQISLYIWQGQNTLQIKVKNWAVANRNPYTNPGGLLYKLTINGNCGDNYFKTHCTLFGEKDLVPGEDYFWRFEDVKPGDHGTNVISLHVYNNEAYVCLINDDIDDQENVLTETETYAGDNSESKGELSDYIELFIWNDKNANGAYNPPTENSLYEGDFIPTEMARLSLSATSTDYLGVAWCLGNQTVSNDTGNISCSGSGNQDKAQTDKLLASLVLYAEQQRNNPNFTCAGVTLP